MNQTMIDVKCNRIVVSLFCEKAMQACYFQPRYVVAASVIKEGDESHVQQLLRGLLFITILSCPRRAIIWPSDSISIAILLI